MPFDAAKLQKFLEKNKSATTAGAGSAPTRTGGKGSVRRKHKAVRKSATHDDKRLKTVLNKLNVRDIPAIEEVNLFKNDGHVIHFASPKVQASIAANTYVISGNSETKKLQDLLPGIINQLGPDNLEDLKKIYATYQPGQKPAGSALSGLGAGKDEEVVPDLVDSFEDVAKGKATATKAAGKADDDEMPPLVSA